MGIVRVNKCGIERKMDERRIDDFNAKGYSQIDIPAQKKTVSKSASVNNERGK